jgi:multicomponent K+:H+ antiporter subunit G
MSPTMVPFWVEVAVAALLVASGVLLLSGALGLLRLKDFFQRMHPVALGTTFGTWCACAASIGYFSALESAPVIHAWLIPILLSITAPITTLLLARTALFRRRAAGDEEMPAPLADRPGRWARERDTDGPAGPGAVKETDAEDAGQTVRSAAGRSAAGRSAEDDADRRP